MAYKIVVDAGHGACELRRGAKSRLQKNTPAETVPPQTEKIITDAERGRLVSFVVERKFSPVPSADTQADRIVKRLLKLWREKTDDNTDCKTYL